MYACSVMSYSVTPWTLACQASLSMGFFQANILEEIIISFPRGSFRPGDQTCVSCVSCIGRQILYHWATEEAQFMLTHWLKMDSNGFISIQSTSHIGEIFTVKPNELLLMAGSFLQQLMAFIWNKKSKIEFHDNLFWQ